MIIRGVILVIFLLVSSLAWCQRIEMVKTFGGVRFERDTLTYSSREVLELMKDMPMAYSEFKLARRKAGMSSLLGFVGGVAIIIPLGSAILGGSPEWILLASGTAFVVASIRLNRDFKKGAQRALDIYNRPFTSRLRPTLNFSPAGINLSLKF